MARAYPKQRASRRPLVRQKCRHCGAEFYAKQSNIEVGKGIFCSQACQRLGRKTRSDKKPRRQYVCQWCGKVFCDDKRVRKTRKYCSNRCLGLSKRKGNKEHPRRKHAAELQHWSREVILRDKACVRCGARENLQAHHIKSYSKHPEQRLNVDNGVALCPLCHHAQHPKHQLDWYLKRGGQTVQRCVVCEREFLPRRKTQRTCSHMCGAKARQSRRTYQKMYSYGD